MRNLRQSMTDKEWAEMEEQSKISAKHGPPVVKILKDLEEDTWVVLINGKEKPIEQMMMSIKDYMDIVQLQDSVEEDDLDSLFKDLVGRWADKYAGPVYRG